MQFPFDILDSIFFFLRSYPKSLIACSNAHPVFSQAAERHLYYHIIFHATSRHRSRPTGNGYSPAPSYLFELLSKTPHLASYVLILMIDFSGLHQGSISEMKSNFRKITPILSTFSALQCIVLAAPYHLFSWNALPKDFTTAVKNCLHSPTLQEVHVEHLNFPLSILDATNVKYLFLSGFPKIPDNSDNANPQLETLSCDINYCRRHHTSFFMAWTKRHIVKLQSLKCDRSMGLVMVSQLLEICSGTLNNLDLHLSAPFERIGCWNTNARVVCASSAPLLPSLPRLQRLTIRADVYYQRDDDDYDPDNFEEDYDSNCWISGLLAVVRILKAAPPPGLLHLIIDIHVKSNPLDYFFKDDMPLFPDFYTVLAESAVSFPWIYLYIHSDGGVTAAKFVALFGDYESLTAFIEQGTLVIHEQETAPGNSQFVDICHDRWKL